MAAALGSLPDHAGKIRLNVIHRAAAAADKVHVGVTDVFIYRALPAQGQPADPAAFGQVIQGTVHRRRADSIRPFEDFLGGQMASPLAEHIQNRPRVSAHPLAHLRFSLPSMVQFYYMIFILICQFFSSVSEDSLPVFCQVDLDILLKTMDKS